MVVSFVGRSVILLRFESTPVNYGRWMLYHVLPNSLDSRMVRLREVSFAGIPLHSTFMFAQAWYKYVYNARAFGGGFNTTTAGLDALSIDHV